jgi:hypothetical protein
MKRAVFLIAAITVALYVGLNLATITFVTLLHRVTIDLSVMDRRTGQPIPLATVAWARSEHSAMELLGSTSTTGQFELVEVIQEQPQWMWPVIGSFQFRGRVLHISAPGYATVDLPLSSALPEVAYRRPQAALTVLMTKAVQDKNREAQEPTQSAAECGDEEFLRTSRVDAAPVVVQTRNPVHPSAITRAPRSRPVLVDVFVRASGEVCAVQVVKGIEPEADELVQSALLQWKWKPAMKGGHAVACVIEIPVNVDPKD